MRRRRRAAPSVLLAILLVALAACSGCSTGEHGARAIRAAAPAPELEPALEPTLRVLSYNIHHGRGLDGRIDLRRLAGVIAALSPDLVALQEVDRGTSRAGGEDQAARLAELTGLHHAYGKAMDYAGGAYGEALLSRWPLHDVRTIDLGRVRGSEPRALLVARIDVPGAGPILFAGTHLAHDAEEDRVDQMQRLDEILRGVDPALPVVVAGDLNAEPGSAPMRIVDGTWTDAAAVAGDARPTFPSVGPERRIDYVLVRPAGRFEIRSARVVEGETASDHCPLLIELVVPRAR